MLSTTSAGSAPASSPPIPSYILRGHAVPVSALRFSARGRVLYSGDTDGFVAVWDLKTFRPKLFWKAHEGGLLSIEEMGHGLLTHARDNLVHYFSLHLSRADPCAVVVDLQRGAATAVPSPASPSPGIEPVWSMDVNAMNFCKMSVVELSPGSSSAKGKGKAVEAEGLVAVPSLTKDDFVDIFHIPSKERAHRSIGVDAFPIGNKTGTVMALHLFLHDSSPSHFRSSQPASSLETPSSTPSTLRSCAGNPQLHLLIGYESGQLALFRFTPTANFTRSPVEAVNAASFDMPLKGKKVDESEGWELVWHEKGHRDAVMSLATSSDTRFAWTVGADHFICKYRVWDINEEETLLPRIHVEATPSPGKAAVAVRSDGRIVGTAGWDGEARLYSAKTLKPLAVLSHHRQSLQALDFAPLSPTPRARRAQSSSSARASGEGESGSDSSSSSSEEDERARAGGRAAGRRGRAWIAAAGQDTKISLWEVYPPQ
ncbi:hypothetical protein JCM21900_005943 [Sporobolomyces salmonicolor]